MPGPTSGGTTDIYIQNRRVAWAQNASATQQTALVRVDVLGQLTSVEILVDGTSCTFQAGSVWVGENDWNAFGITYRPGPTGILTAVDLPQAAYAQIYDVKSRQVVARLQGLKLESLSVTTGRFAAVMSNVTMQGTIMTLGPQDS